MRTKNNADGVDALLRAMAEDFTGLCFVNLVDFGHALRPPQRCGRLRGGASYFDMRLPEIIGALAPDDVLMITADHGCDPGTPRPTTRASTFLFLALGAGVAPGNLGTLCGFDRIGRAVERLCDGMERFAL